MQREAALRDDAERLEAEAAALEASCATLEVENAGIEAVMKLRLGDAHIGAPVKALSPTTASDTRACAHVVNAAETALVLPSGAGNGSVCSVKGMSSSRREHALR